MKEKRQRQMSDWQMPKNHPLGLDELQYVGAHLPTIISQRT